MRMPGFNIPEGSIGRFAVVKLWPEIQTAEDECIARMKIAAQSLGVECIEINADGSLLAAPQLKVSKNNVDFVIHLHYDTPKQYDAFSLVALWNPIEFYHEWGYMRCSRNLTSHDGFLSCGSDVADDHVARMIRNESTHLPVRFHLYHSADIIYKPSIGDAMLFYCGINWEAISGGKSRHQEILKRLDKTGMLKIYGPTILQGVRVWKGYSSYVGELPFDGIHIIDEISKAGVALVLSSQAHKDSGIMSNRLFESIAAGALVICDENQFANKYFGDSLLYIDSRLPIEQVVASITSHLGWAQTHPNQAIAMIAKAQDVFRRKFNLKLNISDLYSGLEQFKEELHIRQNPPAKKLLTVRLNLLMPDYSKTVLINHVHSVCVQEYHNFVPVIVVDRSINRIVRQDIETIISEAPIKIELVELDFYIKDSKSAIKTRRKLGSIILELLNKSFEADAFMVVAPNENLFSNHLSVLAGALQRSPDINCAATAAILVKGDMRVRSVHEVLDFRFFNPMGPTGYGRFIIRMNAVTDDIASALPYLDSRPMAVLIGDKPLSQQLPASIVIDIQDEYPQRIWDEVIENEIIRDYNPNAFNVLTGFQHAVNIAYGKLTIGQVFLKILFTPRWTWAQIMAVKNQGIVARIRVLKNKLVYK